MNLSTKTKLTPLQAIRRKCLDCSSFSIVEVRECPMITCPLYLYRMGKRPKGEESLTDAAEKIETIDSIDLDDQNIEAGE